MRILDRTIHLIDTPGFDDSVRSDEETLQELAYWLVKAYERSILLSGIVLLHRITDTRLYGSAQRALDTIKAICGQEAFCGTVVATTMWDQVPIGEREIALNRHQQLKNGVFSDVVAHRGYLYPLMSAQSDAQAIVRHIMEKGLRLTLTLQKELVNEDLRLQETTAGKILVGGLLQSLASIQRSIDDEDLQKKTIPEALHADRRDLKNTWDQRIKRDHVALRWSTQTYQSYEDRLQDVRNHLKASSRHSGKSQRTLAPQIGHTQECEEATELPATTVSTTPTHTAVPSLSSSAFNAASTAPHDTAIMLELDELKRQYESIMYNQRPRLNWRRSSAHGRGTAAFGVVGTGLAVGQLVAAMACTVM